jgi:hypothetical protein
MASERWLPEIIRRAPERELVVTFQSPLVRSLPYLEEQLAEALHAAHLSWQRAPDGSWQVMLPWPTMVLGIIPRQLEEQVEIRVIAPGKGQGLRLSCRPCRTHDAHAAGVVAVLALAVLAWLIGGWSAGLPASLTTLVAGGIGADLVRHQAIKALERRLQRLAEDLGLAIWPAPPGW